MSDKTVPKARFWSMLLFHCAAGFVLFATLLGLVPKFEALFAKVYRRGDLPAITTFTLALSEYWYYLLAIVIALDAVALFALIRLPRLRWLTGLWLGVVLVAMIVLTAAAYVGLLAPVMTMSTAI